MKVLMAVLSVLSLSTLVVGCNNKACDGICECMGGDLDKCVDDCESRLEEMGDDCQKAVRSWARCLDREDCSETKCEQDEQEMEDACEDLPV